MVQWMMKVTVAALGLSMALAVVVGPIQSAHAQSGAADAMSECGAEMEYHVRSAARKLGRALDRGEYGFRSINLDDLVVILGDDESVEFEVLLEKMGEVAAVVDRRRHWKQTYVVAQADIGPIVVSQTWDVGGECQPITSSVEWPSHPASSVDVEPFRYWGLRAAWRIPSPGMIEAPDIGLEEALKETIVEFASKSDDEDVSVSGR